MKRHLVCLFIVAFFLTSCKQKIAEHERVASSEIQIQKSIEQVLNLMDTQQFEEALSLVGLTYELKDINKFPQKKYLLLCFESEILYYNALFQLGEDKAKEALIFAERNLNGDSAMMGNALNLMCINSENFDPIYQVIPRYEKCLNLLPDHRNPLYSNIAHVASNLGQLYLKEGRLSEAKILLQKSNRYANRDTIYRTLSINYESLVKVAIAQNKLTEAGLFLDSCLYFQNKSKQSDVLLYYWNAKADYFAALKQKDSALRSLKNGQDLILSDANLTQMSIYSFLKSARKLAEKLGKNTYADELLGLEEIQYLKVNSLEEKAKEKIINQFNENISLLEKQENKRLFAEQEIDKKKNLINMLILGFVALLCLVVFIILFLSQKRKLEKLSFEKEKTELSLQNELDKSKEHFQAILDERQRISKEFHDGIAPNLSSLKLICDTLNRKHQSDELMTQMPQIIDETIGDIKHLLNDINPSILLNNGLHFAVNHYVEFVKKPKDELSFNISSAIENKRYTTDIELNMYRIVQEAIQNTLKHTQTNLIDIQMAEMDGKLFVEIKDFGKGFDIQSLKEFKHTPIGNGLKNIYARANQIHASLKIDSNIGTGTTIQILVSL